MKGSLKMALVEYTAFKKVCDICGKDADGYWYRREETNGITNTLFLPPIDLCKDHATFFDMNTSYKNYVVESGSLENYPQEKKQELIDQMKADWEGMEEWERTKLINQ